MRLGLHLPDFTFPDGPAYLGRDLALIARTAEEVGFDRLSVMDHFWQIANVGPKEHEMLEAYTTLGFLAANTSSITLLTLVTGVVYRAPGLLAKAVTTLDVLSGGRAMLGIGAAWNGDEALGLGLSFPPTAERFERLEEAIQICRQMFEGRDEPFTGKHYRLGRTLNSPLPLSSPRPRILIGGSGEQKTLRLVAKYADACNLFPGPDLARKLEVLRRHCEEIGRDYDEIEKTVLFNFDVGPNGERAEPTVAALRSLAEMGFSVAHGRVADVSSIHPLEIIGTEVIPEIADL
ncbi:MAG TPA: LLM class F420-dependent oxidoreductase [Acidimicrobiales bacterium]|nr:LLM class F420-dependent oxidoreductase [Acidimicrobiales bacterium]